jgi:ABC transporter substrate-binding protein PnrA-like
VRRWRARRPSTRLGLALAVVALLLLVAGIATAMYLSIHNWVSSSPRGVQYASDYRLTKVYPAPSPHGAVAWSNFALSANGHDLYAIRSPRWPGSSRILQLVRVTGIDRGVEHHVATTVDLTGIDPRIGGIFVTDVASNGDAFLGIAVNDQPYAKGDGNQLLFVVHPDGSRERFLSSGDLSCAGLTHPDGGWWASLAASAPDRVWIWIQPWGNHRGTQRLVEVTDPNADGRWSDRVLRGISLPRELQSGYWRIAAEHSAGRQSASDLVVVGGNNHVYRVGDRNGDRDLLDPGEVRPLLLERRTAYGGLQIAPVVVTHAGVTRHEIVVSELVAPDRISVITDRGVVRDVARAFRGIQAVLAGPGGQIYVVAEHAVYRLDPLPTGAHVSTSAITAPEPQVVPVPPPLRSGAPRLIFELTGYDRGESLTIGADGTGLRRLIPGTHIRRVCQSADGGVISYWSDAAVPTEGVPFLAKLGSTPVRIPDDAVPRYCGFSSRWIFAGSHRYDVRTGAQHAVPSIVPVQSPDGTKLISLGHLPPRGAQPVGAQTLNVIDLATLERRRLDTQHGSSLFVIQGWWSPSWSPGGSKIAYFTAPPLSRAPWSLVGHRSIVWVRDVATGRALLRLPLRGGRPTLSLSADGTQLLVCIEDRGWQPSCAAGAGYWTDVQQQPGRLLLVDLPSHTAKVVARGRLMFAGWDPSRRRFAYAVGSRLFVRSEQTSARTRHGAEYSVAAPVRLRSAVARLVAGRPLHRSRHRRKHEEPGVRAGAWHPRRRGSDRKGANATTVRPRAVHERPMVAMTIHPLVLASGFAVTATFACSASALLATAIAAPALSHPVFRPVVVVEPRLADAGYTPIVTCGFLASLSSVVVAPSHPATRFVAIDVGREAPRNWTGVRFADEQAAYLAGVAAAFESKSGIVGFVGADDENPAVSAFCAGFTAGARTSCNNIDLQQSYSMSFTALENCRARALTEIRAGADAIFAAAGACGMGALLAARDRRVSGSGLTPNQSGLFAAGAIRVPRR